MTRPARSASAPSQLRGRRGRDAGRPRRSVRGRQPLAADRHAIGVACRDRRAEPDLDAQPLERRACASADSRSGKAGSSARAGLDQDDAGVGADRWRGSRGAAPWRASSAMAPAISTPVGPPPTTTKVSRRAALGRVARRPRPARRRSGCAGGSAVASSIFFRPGRDALPFVVAEIGVPGAGREDQVVVGDPPRLVDDDLRARRVDAGDPAQQHADVGLVRAGWRGSAQAMSAGDRPAVATW